MTTVEWGLAYKGLPRHTDIIRTMRAPETVVGVMAAARRSGKTGIARTLLFLSALEGHDGWYLAPTYSHCRDLFWRPFITECPAELIVGKPNNSEMSLTLRGGGTIACKSTQNPDNLTGRGLSFIACDEYQSMPPRLYEEQLAPILAAVPRANKPQGKLLLTGTPRGKDNHLYTRYMRAGKDPGHFSWHLTAAQAGMVPAEQVERIRMEAVAAGTTATKIWEREWLASFDAFAGQVYSEWNPETMVVDDDDIPARFDEVVGGLDWGFSDTHPGALEILGYVAADDSWWVVDELVQIKQTVESYWRPQVDARMREWTRGINRDGVRRTDDEGALYCDPAQIGRAHV